MSREERLLELLEQEHDRLKASNTELLEAAEYMVEMVDGECPDFVHSAIARAKGEDQ